jgi:hypothetical protein
MSATRDKSQKVTFVFSNFYRLYKKGKQAAMNPHEVDASRHVLKAADVKTLQTRDALNPPAPDLTAPFAVNVREYRPAEFIGKRIPKPPVLPSSTALVSLRANLKSLTDLHSRLKFMLEELEDLVK